MSQITIIDRLIAERIRIISLKDVITRMEQYTRGDDESNLAITYNGLVHRLEKTKNNFNQLKEQIDYDSNEIVMLILNGVVMPELLKGELKQRKIYTDIKKDLKINEIF